jgi:hypothetical protein
LPERNCLEKKITFESVKSYKALSVWLFLPRECLFQQLIKQKNTSLLDYATFLFIILDLTYIGMNEWMTKYLCKMTQYLCKMTQYLWCKMTCIFLFQIHWAAQWSAGAAGQQSQSFDVRSWARHQSWKFSRPGKTIIFTLLYQTFNSFQQRLNLTI